MASIRNRVGLLSAVAQFAGVIATPATAQDTPRDTACVAVYDRIKAVANDTGAVRAARNAYHGCVTFVDSARRQSAIERIAPTIRMLGQLPWNIPEYHDEQRLLDGGSGYGPMVYAFASPFLDGFSRPEQFHAHAAPGVLVAVVDLERLPGEVIPATYSQLGLKDGVNCFWLLASITGGTTTWSASVSNATPGSACSRSDPMFALTARAKKITGMGRDQFPGVARFSESTTGQPLLGVKCIDAWCEIGPAGFVSTAPSNAEAGREGQIKGWHDEQILSENKSGVFTRAVRASVVPRPNIDQLDEGDFSTFRWVATIVLHGNPAGTKYATWGLVQGRNRLFLKREATGAWKAQIQNTAGTRDWNNVMAHKHYDAAVPGTARFRWTVLDEGLWTPCGQQCCKVDGAF